MVNDDVPYKQNIAQFWHHFKSIFHFGTGQCVATILEGPQSTPTEPVNGGPNIFFVLDVFSNKCRAFLLKSFVSMT